MTLEEYVKTVLNLFHKQTPIVRNTVIMYY
jgi:hypothetical protein